MTSAEPKDSGRLGDSCGEGASDGRGPRLARAAAEDEEVDRSCLKGPGLRLTGAPHARTTALGYTAGAGAEAQGQPQAEAAWEGA